MFSLVNKPGHMDRHYNKSINPVVTTSYASTSKNAYSSAGWTYIPSFIAFSPGSLTQSFSAGTFYFQPVEVDVFYKNI